MTGNGVYIDNYINVQLAMPSSISQ